ncbi:alpha/beta hydrolase [Oscillatoria sp. FACHB-1407]|uniref:alpha/beta fold hydrolase n=1 Tax=Oscillatoria sp. FACHB-1407 TaxID=2692847 RepID=UPI001683991D|nr:alpha/beta hydrolase [Oscillatoria sp. FACHB-1407]MBD2460198.1 alpha/beta hydrolase [Oscillatoria sp. FACHB-1407]
MVKTVDVLGVPHAYELTPATDSPVTLVFIHGWLLSREYWQPVIQQLSPAYQCLSYDLRGFGDSQPVEKYGLSRQRLSQAAIATTNSLIATEVSSATAIASPSADYSPAAYANDLAYLLKALGLTNVWLIGHSLGGSIALWAADMLPDIVKGVVCVNSGGGIYLKEEFERFRSAGEQLVKLRPRWLCYLPLVDLVMTRMNVVRPLARQWGRQRLLDLVAAHPEAALGTLLDSTTEEEVHQLPQVVSRLKQPVYFIAGADDTIMESQYVRHLASFHHSFQFCADNVVEISDCGHLAMVEQPERVAAEIDTLLHKH